MNRVRVLWLSSETPDRFGQGGQRRQYFQIRELSRDYEVHVVTLAGPQSDASLRALPSVASVQRIALTIRGIHVPLLGARWRRAIRSGRFDAVIVAHAESWWLYQELVRDASLRTLVDIHNVFSEWYRAAGRNHEALEHEKMESEILRRADAVSVCSMTELGRLRRIHPEIRRGFVAPLGIDPAEWPEQTWSQPRPTVALFGSWDWEPNADGLAWFFRYVWPHVLEEVGDSKALVAGRSMGVLGSLPAGVQTVGRVQDLAAFLGSAAVVAVPVRNGVGASVKFAEALASGSPVIATTDAANAHPAAPAEVTDAPEKWITWIVARLKGRLVEPRPTPARAYALQELTWSQSIQPLRDWLAQGD